jgi:hypothetical protein
LFDLSKDKKKTINTIRQFYNFLNDEIVWSYWSYYEGNTFSGLIQASAQRDMLKQMTKG